MKVLAIETSCDETAVAIVTERDGRFDVEEHVVASQIAEHAKYGGVVPEVAARLHVPTLPRIMKAITNWERGDIDAVAVTVGPGLSTALRVGVETAKALAVAWEVPLIPVDHIEGHIYANFLDVSVPSSLFPALCLVVSGGHTELVLMKGHGDYKLVGGTRDDAVGEAFDKTAAQLGLEYPGGPSVAKMAEHGDPTSIDLPRPMQHSKDFDFSFSGLKTAVRYEIQAHGELDPTFVANISASFQQAAIDSLITKTKKAANKFAPSTIMLCGGVSANKELRRQLAETFADSSIDVIVPEMKYTTDNAAMIAAAGLQALKDGRVAKDIFEIDADPSKQLGGKWKWEEQARNEPMDASANPAVGTPFCASAPVKSSSHTTSSVHEMYDVAASMVNELMDAHTILLQGDLGSGKTTFVQGVAKAFGATRPVRSPTFTLVNEYPVTHERIDRIVHIDLYRLDDVDENSARDLGLPVYLSDPRALVLIEWPERAKMLIDGMTLRFKIEGKNHTVSK